MLQANLDKVDALADAPTWSGIMEPLEALEAELAALWGPLRHLNAVSNSEPLRACHDACLPLLTNYFNTLGQHQGLYGAYERLAEAGAGPEPGSSGPWPRPFVAFVPVALIYPRGAGGVPGADASAFGLSNRFTKNLLDSTDAFSSEVKAAARLRAYLRMSASGPSLRRGRDRAATEHPYLSGDDLRRGRSLRELHTKHG